MGCSNLTVKAPVMLPVGVLGGLCTVATQREPLVFTCTLTKPPPYTKIKRVQGPPALHPIIIERTSGGLYFILYLYCLCLSIYFRFYMCFFQAFSLFVHSAFMNYSCVFTLLRWLLPENKGIFPSERGVCPVFGIKTTARRLQGRLLPPPQGGHPCNRIGRVVYNHRRGTAPHGGRAVPGAPQARGRAARRKRHRTGCRLRVQKRVAIMRRRATGAELVRVIATLAARGR